MSICVDDRVYLSEVREVDAAACVQHLSAKEIYDCTLRIPYPYREADFRYWLGRIEQTTAQFGRNFTWAIRTSDGFMIGAIGFLEGFDVGKAHRAEIGYWIAKPYWGRGIMTAVVRRLCALAFDELGLIKISAEVFAKNGASARVLEKCGFVQEGYLQKHYEKDGQFNDARAFALLK